MIGLGVVVIDCNFQPLQKIGDGRGNPAPIGDQRNAERILHKGLACQFNAFCKGLDSHAFLMAVKVGAVDGRIVIVFRDGFLGRS